MITLKSAHEIELMRRAGKITAAARALAGEMVKPGVTTREIDKAVFHFIRSQGAEPSFLNYNGYPASTGLDGPAVAHLANGCGSRVHHWFDGDRHAAQQLRPVARRPVVGDLGRFVHVSADAMADILAHDGEAVRLHIRLHGVGDVGDAVALAGLRKSENTILITAGEPEILTAPAP